MIASLLLLAATAPGPFGLDFVGPVATPAPRGSSRASGSPATQDDGGLAHRGDVLPAEVDEGLPPEVGQTVLGNVGQIHLLIDPRLLGPREPSEGNPEGETPSLAELLALEGTELPDSLLGALARESDFGESTVHRLLNNVLDDYLNLFFRDVQRGSSLTRHLRSESVPALKKLFFTADLQAGSVVIDGESRLRVKLHLTLVHISLQSEPPFAIHSLERLWSDRGYGEASLPTPSAAGTLDADEVDRAFRAACIDALRGGLALSLWGNSRLARGQWTRPRPDVVGEPLTTSDNFQYRGDRKGPRQ